MPHTLTRSRSIIAGIAGLFAVALACLLASQPARCANSNAPFLSADQQFLRAMSRGDRAAQSSLLDEHFTRITIKRAILTKRQFLQLATAGSLENASGTTPMSRRWGDIGVVFGAEGNLHYLRVWARRPTGWRLLIYQSTPGVIPATAATSEPPKAAGYECVNPCKYIPYNPKSTAEHDIIASWEAIETAVTHSDADAWSKHVGDDLFGLLPGPRLIITKPERIAQIEQQKRAGKSPILAQFVSGQFFNFGNTAVTVFVEKPPSGARVYFTRIWVKRSGIWQIVGGAET